MLSGVLKRTLLGGTVHSNFLRPSIEMRFAPRICQFVRGHECGFPYPRGLDGSGRRNVPGGGGGSRKRPTRSG
jgi:hypothetical protein